MPFEWFQSFCIILLFIIFLSINVFGSGVKNVKDNWALYRCNPLILPFAGYMSPDKTTTSDNFSFCVQNIVFNIAPTITQPFEYLQYMTMDMMDSINTSNDKTTEETSDVKGNTADAISGLYEVFLNIIISFNIIVTKLIDTQGKMAGVMSSIMHIMTSVQYTFESMWRGIPGEMIKTIGKLS